MGMVSAYLRSALTLRKLTWRINEEEPNTFAACVANMQCELGPFREPSGLIVDVRNTLLADHISRDLRELLKMQEFNLVVLYLCKFPEIALRLHMNVMKLKVIIVEDSTTELNDNWRCLESNPQTFSACLLLQDRGGYHGATPLLEWWAY